MACWGVPTSRRGRRPLLSTKQGEQSSSCGRGTGSRDRKVPARELALQLASGPWQWEMLLLEDSSCSCVSSPCFSCPLHPIHITSHSPFGSLCIYFSLQPPLPSPFFLFYSWETKKLSHFEEESELLSPAGLQSLTKCSCSAVLTQANSVGTRCVFQSLLPLTSLLTTGIDCLRFAPSN